MIGFGFEWVRVWGGVGVWVWVWVAGCVRVSGWVVWLGAWRGEEWRVVEGRDGWCVGGSWV